MISTFSKKQLQAELSKLDCREHELQQRYRDKGHAQEASAWWEAAAYGNAIRRPQAEALAMGIKTSREIKEEGVRLRNLTGRSPGGAEVHDYRTPRETKPLKRTRKAGFPDK